MQEETNKMCQLCNLNAQGYYSKWLWVDSEKNLVELVLEIDDGDSHLWEGHLDEFNMVRTGVNFCPECGRSKEEIIEEWRERYEK